MVTRNTYLQGAKLVLLLALQKVKLQIHSKTSINMLLSMIPFSQQLRILFTVILPYQIFWLFPGYWKKVQNTCLNVVFPKCEINSTTTNLINHEISKKYDKKQTNKPFIKTSRHVGLHSMYYTLEHLNMKAEYYVLKLCFKIILDGMQNTRKI